MSIAAMAERLFAAPAVAASREVLADREEVWIVGGALRDAALDRDVVDLDLAVAGDVEEAARALARRTKAHALELSGEFATWRVVSRGGWHVDLAGLRGAAIEDDLGARDFTIDALALPLGALDGPTPERELLDPHGGLADLDARLLRAVSERSFADDPLRLLRAARLAAALGLEVEPGTLALARAEAPRAAEPAGERQLAELRGIVCGPDPLRGLGLMDELGAGAVVLPELEALRGIEQTPYHQHDAHGHTIEVLAQLLALQGDLPLYVGEHSDGVGAALAEPLADEMSRGEALRFGALFHDLGKPRTRAVSAEGRVTFMGHDQVGARMVREICERLRASRRLSQFLEAICLHHLRLGFLVAERPLARRAVYEYLCATEPHCVEVTVLTIADRLATRGERTRQEAIDAHLELAREMLAEALAWRRDGPPRSPIPGDELAAELGMEPGPELGRLLAAIEAAVFAGEVGSREDAIALARDLRA